MHQTTKLIVFVLIFLSISSTGVVAVNKQTSDFIMTATNFTTPDSGIAPMVYPVHRSSSVSESSTSASPYKIPTTLVCYTSKQSLEYGGNVQISAYLRTGATGCPGQVFELWSKTGTSGWVKACTGTTGTDSTSGRADGTIWNNNPAPEINRFQLKYYGNSEMASATSNIVTVKFENTKTKPYLTTLYAYAPKQVVAKGTSAPINVKLMHGNTPLSGKNIKVWRRDSGKWKLISTILTSTGSKAGWAQVKNNLTKAGKGLYLFTFNGDSLYDRSKSNTVQLIWR